MKKYLVLFGLMALFLLNGMVSFADAPSECPQCKHTDWMPTEITVNPTCTEDGFTGYKCGITGCGYIHKISTTPAYGHNFIGSNPRVCCNPDCSAANPDALTGFSYTVETNLYSYQAPSSTTLMSVAVPNTATGHIDYSVTPAGIIGLGSGNESAISGAALNSRLSVNAIKAGSAVLSLKIFDGCGYYRTEQCTITVTGEPLEAPASIEVYPKSATIEPGKTITISASVLPSQADQTVSWYSDNPTVATVANGVITGVGPGYATVTVASMKDKTIYTPITVYVPDVKVSSISFSSKTAVLNIGSNTTISYEIFPANSVNKTLTWESSNPSVAYVDSKGCIYGIAAGVAVITAYSSDKTVSETCSVTVTSTVSPTSVPGTLHTTHYSPGYYASGSTYDDTNYTGYLMYIRGPQYTRTGYTQTGWSLDYYGQTLDYSFYTSYNSSSDLNLYPYWTANPSSPLKLTINYDSSLGTVYFNGKVFPSGHYWSIHEGETLNFSFSPIQDYYASYIKLAGRYLGIYNNSFTVHYSDMRASDQSAYVSFVSRYSPPKTGDDAQPGLWLTLAVLSSVSLTAAALGLHKKKKN